MPIIQSAITRARQNEVRRVRRLPYKTEMKTMIKKVHAAAKGGKKDEMQKALSVAYKAIDTAAKKHLIHPSNAARKKSSLAKLVAKA